MYYVLRQESEHTARIFLKKLRIFLGLFVVPDFRANIPSLKKSSIGKIK
jgi:hypothetical protein